MFALLALHSEVKGRDQYWAGAMHEWPVHTCTPAGECSVDPCGPDWRGQWEGVECRYQGALPASAPRVVTNLHLPKRNLQGTIPTAIALLRNLTEIDLVGGRPCTAQSRCHFPQHCGPAPALQTAA